MPPIYSPILLPVPHLQQPTDGDCLPELPDAPVTVSHGDFDLAWLAQDERFAVISV